MVSVTERVLGLPAHYLDAFNHRHPWSHNDHFHGWVLRHLPARRRTAVDVGCGRGLLVSLLAPEFDRVVGLDADAEMAGIAGERLSGVPHVEVVHQGFEEYAAQAGPGSVDLVTMVASLHHLEIEPALRTVADLLAPGGRLLVVGLAKPSGPADLAVDLVSSVLNPLVGLVKHPRPVRHPSRDPGMPIRMPDRRFADIGRTARRILPGAVVRRRLFFRYTLAWTKPGQNQVERR